MLRFNRDEDDKIGDMEIALYSYRKAYRAFMNHIEQYGHLNPHYDKESVERNRLGDDYRAKRQKFYDLVKNYEAQFPITTELITLP